MYMLSPLRLTLLAAALAAAFPTFAQDTSAPAPVRAETAPAAGEQKMQKVEVRAQCRELRPAPRRHRHQDRRRPGRDRQYGDTNVADVLKRVPGITVSSPNGRNAEIRMRGLGAGYTQILINGERAPNGFTLDSLSPDVIERIEVLRAASAEFSTQSVAGTVNIVLKKTARSGQREFKLGARTGSGFSGPTANIQLSDKLGKMSYSIAGSVMAEQMKRESVSDDMVPT